jgi:hypothetical protein
MAVGVLISASVDLEERGHVRPIALPREHTDRYSTFFHLMDPHEGDPDPPGRPLCSARAPTIA